MPTHRALQNPKKPNTLNILKCPRPPGDGHIEAPPVRREADVAHGVGAHRGQYHYIRLPPLRFVRFVFI